MSSLLAGDPLFLRGWGWILGGAVLIGVGGIFTTFGWDALNERSRMRNLVTAVAREWEINDTLLKHERVFNPADSVALRSRHLYPRLRTNALDAVLSSGAFDASDRRDREFLRKVADYETSVSDFNARLNVSEELVILKEPEETVLKHRRELLSSPGFQGILREHQGMGEILQQQFPWARKQRFLQ